MRRKKCSRDSSRPTLYNFMIIALASQFHIFLLCLSVKALVSVFKQEKALVGATYVIVQTDGSFAALILILGPMHNCRRVYIHICSAEDNVFVPVPSSRRSITSPPSSKLYPRKETV